MFLFTIKTKQHIPHNFIDHYVPMYIVHKNCDFLCGMEYVLFDIEYTRQSILM
jgi:hypothetical protein